jgi:hypothetical protein
VWLKTYGRLGVRKGDPKKYIHGHQGKDVARHTWRVDTTTGCWIWLGNIEDGYGRIAHRLAYAVIYQQYKGPKPAGTEFDHTCRNRACVNPDHLEPVTHAENSRRGQHTKLRASDVLEIRRLLAEGQLTQPQIAARFNGITKAAVSMIKGNYSWKDVQL